MWFWLMVVATSFWSIAFVSDLRGAVVLIFELIFELFKIFLAYYMLYTFDKYIVFENKACGKDG